MKQRFSAGGSLAVWISSSLKALEKAGFTDISLSEDNSLRAGHNDSLFTVLFHQSSPGQITLEIDGTDDKDINLYKYNVARILQEALKNPDAEEAALADIAAARSRRSEPEADEFIEAVTAEQIGRSDIQEPVREETPAEAAAPSEPTETAGPETEAAEPEAVSEPEQVTPAAAEETEPAAQTSSEAAAEEASEPDHVEIAEPEPPEESVQNEGGGLASLFASLRGKKREPEETESVSVTETAESETVEEAQPEESAPQPEAEPADTGEEYPGTVQPSEPTPVEASETSEEPEKSSEPAETSETSESLKEDETTESVPEKTEDTSFEIPDFSELIEGVTSPLPAVTLPEGTVTEEVSIGEMLSQDYKTEAASVPEEQSAEEAPATDDSEKLSEPKHPAQDVTVYTTPDDADAVVVIGEETAPPSETAPSESAPEDEAAKSALLSEEHHEYEDLKPIENPTTAGELYNNMLLETSGPSDTTAEEVKAAMPKKPWYKQDWFALLMLILVPPVGLILIWHFKIYTPRARKIVTAFFALYLILWGWLVAMPFLPARTTTSGNVEVTADSVETPSKQDQVAEYWNNSDVQNFMTTIPTDMSEYGTIVSGVGIAGAPDQVVAIMQNLTDLDNAVLKITDVGSDNAAYSVQQKVNQAAVAYNEAALNMQSAMQNSDSALLQTAQQQLTNATSVFEEITGVYNAAVAE